MGAVRHAFHKTIDKHPLALGFHFELSNDLNARTGLLSLVCPQGHCRGSPGFAFHLLLAVSKILQEQNKTECSPRRLRFSYPFQILTVHSHKGVRLTKVNVHCLPSRATLAV